MGILDDLKMGLGFKEKDRDYYDRTEKTLRRTQGDKRAGQYREYLGKGSGPFATVTSKSNPRYGQQARDQSGNPYRTHAGRYADAPNYSSPIGPNVSDFRQGSRPSNAPTPGTFGHSMGKMPGMMGLLARFLNGSGNNLPEQPLMSNAQRQVRPQRRGAPQRAAQSGGTGYAAPQVDASYLNDQPPVIDTTPMNPLNFRWDLNIGQTREQPSNNRRTPENPTGVMNISQPDSYFAGVPPSQRPGAVTETVSDMGPLMDDLPRLIPLTSESLRSANVNVEPDDAAFQEWLDTNDGKQMQQWEESNPGFARRMYDASVRLKRGKF